MPVPATIADLSTVASLNSPQGGDFVGGMIDDYFRAHAAIIKNQFVKGADIPSASTITIPPEGSLFAVTGSTAIASLAASVAGRLVFLKFDAGIVLTNSASLILPNGANITTYADQVLAFVADSSGWRLAGGAGILALVPGPNALINSNFAINQDVVSGTVTLAAGAYGHDMWKAGASGCTYTFATVANVTTVTITAGSLLQIIEGTNLQSGPYTLSWAGTAQGRIDSGAYGPSPITGTAVGGTNQSVEFGIGTLSKVKYESGTVATPWCGYNGIYGGDSDAVLRYNEYSYDAGTFPGLTTNNGCEELVSFSTVIGTVGHSVRFKKKKYATPTVVVYSTSGGAMGFMYDSGGGVNRSASYASIGQSGFYVFNAVVTTAPANHLFHWHAQARL